MNKKYLGLFAALLGTTAWAGGEPKPGMPSNLAVDINGPGAARADIAIAIPSLKEERRYSLTVSHEGLVGGIYVPPGKENRITVTVFDVNGEKLYGGSGYANVGEKFTSQVDIALSGKETKDVLLAKFGTWRFALDVAVNAGDGLMVQTTLIDAAGRHLEIKPDDILWRGGPDKFEMYSCFDGSLCFEMPDLGKYADMLACYRDVVCSHQKPRDTRGPWRYVAVGRTHTCGLTVSNDLLCWGDNTAGQLRSAVTSSSVPIPVVCGPGEVCKFQSVSAGAERTCAVDTIGKLWCWGTTGDNATGDRGTNTSRFDGEIDASDLNGNKILFTTVDLDLMDGCAISIGGALYCWHGAPSSLDDHDIHNRGTTLYRSVSVGKRHVCAQTTGFKLECFGDNTDGQITGNFPGFPAQISPELQQIFKRGGHVPAAGAMNSCAQDPDDNTICWGSPTRLPAATQETGGFIALWRSYATSLSTNTDVCEFGVGNFLPCTRTCATALGGDLFCGNWGGPRPPQLTLVPDPPSDHYVSWSHTDVGPGHVCAVDFQRDIWCFGMNDAGQLGLAPFSNSRTTVPTAPVSRFPNGIATLLIP